VAILLRVDGQQIAGELLDGGAIAEEYQTEYVVDRVETTFTVWMGMTLGCARCTTTSTIPQQKEFYSSSPLQRHSGKSLDGRTGNAEPASASSSAQREELERLKLEIAAKEKALPEKEVAAMKTLGRKRGGHAGGGDA